MKLLRKWMAYLRELAEELADETAYRRYLENASLEHSPEAWRNFSDARFKQKYRQGKCC